MNKVLSHTINTACLAMLLHFRCCRRLKRNSAGIFLIIHKLVSGNNCAIIFESWRSFESRAGSATFASYELFCVIGLNRDDGENS